MNEMTMNSRDMKHLSNPIGHLPPRQQEAVNKCMEEVQLFRMRPSSPAEQLEIKFTV